MTDNLLVICPLCKSDDCVDSVRCDNCTACGWVQQVPISAFQPEREKKHEHFWKCDCGIAQFTKPIPAPLLGYCCDNDNFEDKHVRQKQPPKAAGGEDENRRV